MKVKPPLAQFYHNRDTEVALTWVAPTIGASTGACPYLFCKGIGIRFVLLMLGLTVLLSGCNAATVPVNLPPPAATFAPSIVAPTSNASDATVSPVLTLGKAPSGTPMFIGAEYLSLGDSIAYGLGAPTPNQQGYTGIFYNNYLKRVRPDLLYFRQLGVASETSQSFFEGDSRGLGDSQYQRMLKVLGDATDAGRIVSPITVTLGGNDMLDARNKPEAEKALVLSRFEANFARLLDELKSKADPKATIFVTTYYNPYAVSTFGLDADTDWVKRFNQTITRLATDRGIRVVDFFEPIFGNEEQLTWIRVGDIHPNRTGYALLAQKLWQASNYDQQAPSITLTYNPVTVRPLPVGKQLAFKLAVQDNFARFALDDIITAGSISSVTANVDAKAKGTVAPVPPRYRTNANTPEFSYVLNTNELSSGSHTLRFEATDSAGLSSTLEITFEVI